MEKLIKKSTYYTNKDNQEFTLEKYTTGGNVLEFKTGNTAFYLLSSEEVDEFINLLKEKQKEIWP